MSETKEVTPVPNPLENFDWDSIGKKQEKYTAEEKQKLDELYANTLKTINNNEVVEGTIVTMNNREVVVNIGFKSDGIVPLSEFRYNPDLKPGDKVEVYIENQEDASGQLILSHKKARATKAWDRVKEALA